MKKFKFLGIVFAMTLIFTSFTTITALAANTSDTSYSTGSMSSVGSNYYASQSPNRYRAKQNTTATYVYSQSGSSCYFAVWGYSSSSGGTQYSADTISRGLIAPGQRRFLRQWVYENGHPYAALIASPVSANTSNAGLWSPDSVGSYAYAN
jgi:hypothetical protein